MKQPRNSDLNACLSEKARQVLAYLEQVYYLKLDLENLLARIEEKNMQAVSLSSPSDYSGAKIQHTAFQEARFEACVAEKEQLEKDYREMLEQYEPLKSQALQIIRRYTSLPHRTVLEWHFIKGFSWKAVAGRVNRTDRQVYRIRSEALEMITLPEDAIWLE